MIELSLNTADVNRVLSSLEGTQHLRDAMETSLAILHDNIARYPRQRTGSRYVRGRGMANAQGRVTRLTSQRLGTRWTTKITSSATELRGKVGNNVTYGPYVQDAQRQARVHAGVWSTDQSVMDLHRGEILGIFDRALRNFGSN